MLTSQYRISLLFWLMIMVAVSAALAGISRQFLFMVVAFWIVSAHHNQWFGFRRDADL